MNLNSILTLAAAVVLVAGCSSAPTTVNKGAIPARTFSFVQKRAASIDADRPDPRRTAAHQMVQDAITRKLAAQGVTRVASGGDVTVGYLVILGNNAVTERIDDYFGSPETADALQQKAHKAYTESKNPNEFEAGTLVVDIINSQDFKLLKRSYVTRPALRNATDDVRAARIQEAVYAVLQDVQFTR